MNTKYAKYKLFYSLIYMRQSHLIFTNAVSIWISRMLRLLPQLFLVPFLIRKIGDAGYGVYALTLSLMMSIDSLQISLHSGVIKYSAAFLAQNRLVDVNRIVSTSWVCSAILGIIGSLTGLSIAIFYRSRNDVLAFSLFITSVMLFLVVPLAPYIGIIRAKQRYYVPAIIQTIAAYLNLIIIVVWFEFIGPSVEMLLVITMITFVVSVVAQVPIAYRLIPGLSNNPRLFNWRMFSGLASFGTIVVLCTLCTVVNTAGIRWLAGTWISTRFVAHLSIMLMPAILLEQIVSAVVVTIMPAASAYQAKGDYKMLGKLLIFGMRYSTMLVVAGIIVAILSIDNIFSAWLGKEYQFLSFLTLTIFCGRAFSLSTACAHNMLRGLGKLKISLINSLVGLVIVPLAVIVTMYIMSKEPYISFTIAILLGNIVYGIMQIGFIVRAVRADYKDIVMRVYAQPIIPAMVVLVLVFGLINCYDIDGFLERIVVSVLAVLLFAISFYIFFSTSLERQRYRELTRLGLNRLSEMRQRYF